MIPYLKGLHQTLDSWRDWVDMESGWKLQHREIMAIMDEGDDAMDRYKGAEDAPEFVTPAPRLKSDVAALSEMMKPTKPPPTAHGNKRRRPPRQHHQPQQQNNIGTATTTQHQ